VTEKTRNVKRSGSKRIKKRSRGAAKKTKEGTSSAVRKIGNENRNDAKKI
jgi:hypothetical protein